MKKQATDRWKSRFSDGLWGGRKHPFCRDCDVIDAGERENYIKTVMKTKV